MRFTKKKKKIVRAIDNDWQVSSVFILTMIERVILDLSLEFARRCTDMPSDEKMVSQLIPDITSMPPIRFSTCFRLYSDWVWIFKSVTSKKSQLNDKLPP